MKISVKRRGVLQVFGGVAATVGRRVDLVVHLRWEGCVAVVGVPTLEKLVVESDLIFANT